jgi:hypothetical protein
MPDPYERIVVVAEYARPFCGPVPSKRAVYHYFAGAFKPSTYAAG